MPLLPVLTAFLSGLIFSVGLILAGMIDPARVLAFLDVRGAWDPGLGLVMLTAIVVAAPAYYWVRRKHKTLLRQASHVPRRRPLNRRVFFGSVVFGLGWGLSGLCPGPGLILAGSGNIPALCFVLAMLAGMHFSLRTELYLLRRGRRRKGKSQ